MSAPVRHRYENMEPRPSVQYLVQQERIKMDESIAAREYENKLASDISLKSDWKESAQGKVSNQLLKAEQNEIDRELHQARRANMMVRRAALKHLLAKEYAQYEEEFKAMGKAFYIKRT